MISANVAFAKGYLFQSFLAIVTGMALYQRFLEKKWGKFLLGLDVRKMFCILSKQMPYGFSQGRVRNVPTYYKAEYQDRCFERVGGFCDGRFRRWHEMERSPELW